MLMDWYSGLVHEGIAEFAAERGWMLNSHMAQWRTRPDGWNGDGVLATVGVGSESLGFIERLGLPTVDLGLHYPGIFPGVAADNHESGRLAARHYIERGHRHFAFLFFQNSLVEQERFDGFSQELRGAGHKPLELHWTQKTTEVSVDYAQTMEWAKHHLVALPKPCAVNCGGDYIASMILDACVESGIRVPEEIMVIGAGNDRLICEFASVPLTSVDVRQREIGRRAAQLLESLMDGNPAPKKIIRVKAGSITERQSTRFRAVFDPTVREALSFIWRNYHRKISVDDVTAQVPVSRSTLYAAFEQEIGVTMAKAITQVRMENACQLLRETVTPIQEIALRCGFSGPIVFHNAFHRETGIGPREWRQKFGAPQA